MRCMEVRRDMFAFLDGAVSVERNLEILQHLNLCPACAKRFEAERRFEGSLTEILRAEAPPPTLRARLDAALDRAEADGTEGDAAPADAAPATAGAGRGRLPRPGRARVRRLVLAAAAVFAAAILVADHACLGPFQCPIIKASVEVAERVARGDTPYCVLCADVATVERTVAAGGRTDFHPPDLSSAGYAVVGAAAAVPAASLGGTGALCDYKSRFGDVAFVQIPVGPHDPKPWNRVAGEGRVLWRAAWNGYRVLGWKEDGKFRALVTESPHADLEALARTAWR